MIRWFTAGESHGQGLMIIMEGVPAALPISEEYIGAQLARRQRGYGRGGRQLIEQDWAHIQTGVRHGLTLGSPIGMTIENKDWANWTEAMAVEYVENPSQEGRNRRVTRIRPGHADLPGTMKYGFSDVRNVLERASARETAAASPPAPSPCACWRSSASGSTATSYPSAASGPTPPTPTMPSTGKPLRNRRCAAPTLKQRQR